MWWRDFLFFLFPLVGEKNTDNKDSERWRRKERRDVINELQHLRRDGPAAGGGGSGVLLISPWLFSLLYPPQHARPAGAEQGSAQAF